MSHGFQVTFSPGRVSMSTTIVAMESVLDEFRFSIDADVYELEQEGQETSGVADLIPWSAGSLAEIAFKSRGWYGVGICLVSKDLYDLFGKGTAAEASLEICRRGKSSSTVLYRESSSAWRARRQAERLMEQMGQMMLRIATLNGSTHAIYDEESQVIAATAVKSTVMETLTSGRFPSGGFDGMALLPASEFTVCKRALPKIQMSLSWQSGEAIALYLDRPDAKV